MRSLFGAPTWLQISLYAVLALVLIGFVCTLVYGMCRALLACLRVTPWLLSWTWAKLTGTPLISHGSAHFADASEIDASGLLNDTGMSLAQLPDGRILREPLGQHVGLTAPSRSHKSWGFLRPNIRAFDGSIVVADPRGELYRMCREDREKLGPTFRFAPGEEESCVINPLSALRWGTSREYGDVDRLTHTLLGSVPDGENPVFKEMAKPWLKALMVDQHQRPDGGSLAGVHRWIDDATSDLLDRIRALQSSPIQTVKEGGTNMANLFRSDRLFDSVMTALRMAVEPFADPLVAQHTSGESDVRLEALQHGLRPISIFLCTEFTDHDRLRAILAALIEQCIALWSAQGQTRQRKVLLALDEIMNLPAMRGLESGISFLAGCQVQCVLVFQNEKQLLNTYGETSPILDSLATRLYFTPMPGDRETREEISASLGIRTASYATRTETTSAFGMLQRVSHGSQRTGRPLMLPDEIARLSDDACIVMTKGAPPTMALKLDATPAAIAALVQQAKPIMRKVALATAACLVAGLVSTWALWPTSTPPTPKLALTTDAGGLPAASPAGSMNARGTTDPSDPDLLARYRMPHAEREAVRESSPEDRMGALSRLTLQPEAAKPWVIYSQVRQNGWTTASGGGLSGLPTGRYATLADCQTALHRTMDGYITQRRQQSAAVPQLRLKTDVIDKPGYVSITESQPGVMAPRTSESVCYLQAEE